MLEKKRKLSCALFQKNSDTSWQMASCMTGWKKLDDLENKLLKNLSK
jgi:hypothetical protein